MTRLAFVLRMAWRETRAEARHLALLLGAVAVGVAALVAINSFTSNVQESVRLQARALLGADLSFSSRRPFSPAVEAVLDSLPATGTARVTNFPAMAYVARTTGSRLVQASAVQGPFPFYGAIKTEPGPAWGSLATAKVEPDGASTTVGDLIVQPDGGDGTSISLEGAWALPRIGYDPTPVGLSADGKTLVLVPAGAVDAAGTSRTTSRFAIVPFPPIAGAPQLAPRIVELPGHLDFDAISPDGRILYVVEHLDGNGGYQVRAVDLPAGTMRPDIITDKRNIGEEMAGWPLAQVRSSTGMVMTLYRGTDHPFIHALNAAEAWAVCIDLPGGGSESQDADWGLAASESFASIYAVNATRGLAIDVDPSELVARRTVTLATAMAPTFELAKFGHSEGGPVGRRVIAAPSGQTVFAAGKDGVLRLNRNLTVDARLLPGSSIQSIGLAPDGRTLFALREDGAIVAVDASTGEAVGEVAGGGFDRLAAVMPW